MKKIVIAICVISAVVAIILGICLSTSKPNKHASSEILTTFSEEEFFSNYQTLPEKSLLTYTVRFTALNGKSFENPSITSSNNITKTVETTDSIITVTFQILFGDEFSFTLLSNNFETLVITKQATEFVQPDTINISIYTTPSGQQVGYVDQSTNIVYIIDEQYKTQALEDGKPSTLYIKPYSPASCKNPTFDASVAENGHIAIINQNEFFAISPKSIGASYITFSANDGSGASKKFLFRAEYVKAENVSGLPSKIDIELSESGVYELPVLSPVPIYAKDYEISFETSSPDLFTISNNKIEALKSGKGALIVKLDGVVFRTIPVDITGTFTPKFLFSLNDYTTETLSNNISFDESTNTITLNCANLEYDYSTITFNVAFMYYSGTLSPITADITDLSTAVLQDATTPGFGVASQNYVPYTINVLHKNAEIEIEFSKNLYGNLIKSKIKIILNFN